MLVELELDTCWDQHPCSSMALPILGVNGLGEGTEFMEDVRFANVGDLVLDAGWKSTIHLLVEGGIAPLDTGG